MAITNFAFGHGGFLSFFLGGVLVVRLLNKTRQCALAAGADAVVWAEGWQIGMPQTHPDHRARFASEDAFHGRRIDQRPVVVQSGSTREFSRDRRPTMRLLEVA